MGSLVPALEGGTMHHMRLARTSRPPAPDPANVNSLKSFETEMPFEYYTLPFCKPPEGVKRSAATTNPGTILEGLRIENSPYNFTMRVRSTGWHGHGGRGMRLHERPHA